MTNKRNTGVSYGVVAVLVIIAFVVGAGAGIGGFIFVTGGDGEASRPIEDVIAQVDTNNTADDSTEAQTDETDNTTADESTPTESDNASDETVASAQSFGIVAEQSTATFTLEEDLRGVRTTVIGTTSDVGGTISVNMSDPSASSIGTIAINARTLATDNDFRNRAIRSRILRSAEDAYEFIIFEPTSLSNFSAETVSVGDTLTFDVTGNLTITGVTQEVTFNTSVTLDSETQISGTATANVLYADYGLTIPDVPSVANVTDDVDLELAFVATVGE